MPDSPLIPDPLQDFSNLARLLRPQLDETDLLRAEYASRHERGSILPNLVEAIRIESTYNSNAIEGSTLTLRQTQLVIEGTVPPGNASMRELYEARNHDSALRMVEAWAEDRSRNSPLAEEDILQIHERVMTDAAPGYAGQFRTDRVLIAGSGHIPPHSRKFDELIPAMLRLANRSEIHPR